MKNYLAVLMVLLLLTPLSKAWAVLSEDQQRDYDTLAAAVVAASLVVSGEYGDRIPADFDTSRFMRLVRANVPEEFSSALEKYRIDVKPKGSYYFLTVSDPVTNSVILFDYSCSMRPDGLVLLEPEKFDLEDLDRYDNCRLPKGK